MIVRIFFGVLCLIAAMVYLSYLNPDSLQLQFAPGASFPISISLLILSSMGIGAFVMMLAVIFRDTRKGLVEWREKAQLKKKEKIMDFYRQGVNALLSKKRSEALKSFQKILEQEPKHRDALLRLGEVYRYNGNLNEAIRIHAKARSIAPESLSVLFALGKDYRRSGQLGEAAEIYRTILKIDEKNLGAFLKLRDLYEKEQRWDKAYALQKEYWDLKKNPQEKKRLLYYQFMSARLLDPEKEKEKVIKLYAELIKADRKFAAPYLELGKIYESRGNEKDAVKTWKTGFKETGGAVFLEALDEFYRKREEPANIIKVYKEAINRFPDNPTFRFLLGKSYYRLEMIDDALEILEHFKHQGVSSPLMQQILGDIYYKRGRMEEAFLEYKDSVNFIQPVMNHYSCKTCGEEQERWCPRCPNCGKLEPLTIQLSRPEKARVPTRINAAMKP